MVVSLGNLPTDGQKAALVGNDGTPGSANTYSTESGNIVGLKSGGTAYTTTRIKFAQSGTGGITVTEDGTDLLVTISAFRSTAPLTDNGTGTAGASGEFADGAHRHPLSTDYRLQTLFSAGGITWQTHITVTTGASFQPLAMLCASNTNLGAGFSRSTGFAVGTGSSNQECEFVNFSFSQGVQASACMAHNATYYMAVTTWGTTNVILSDYGGAPGGSTAWGYWLLLLGSKM